MGLKNLKKTFPHQYELSEAMYGFRVDHSKRLGPQADKAASRILIAGQTTRDGRMAPGYNNVMADFAAAAFSQKDLQDLRASNSPLDKGFARIIKLRQDFAALCDADEAAGKDPYWLHTDKLDDIRKVADRLETRFGWKPHIA